MLKKLRFWMVRMQLTTNHLVRDRRVAKRSDDRERVRARVHDGAGVRGGVREIAL
jgi:hypothetical protein